MAVDYVGSAFVPATQIELRHDTTRQASNERKFSHSHDTTTRRHDDPPDIGIVDKTTNRHVDMSTRRYVDTSICRQSASRAHTRTPVRPAPAGRCRLRDWSHGFPCGGGR